MNRIGWKNKAMFYDFLVEFQEKKLENIVWWYMTGSCYRMKRVEPYDHPGAVCQPNLISFKIKLFEKRNPIVLKLVCDLGGVMQKGLLAADPSNEDLHSSCGEREASGVTVPKGHLSITHRKRLFIRFIPLANKRNIFLPAQRASINHS